MLPDNIIKPVNKGEAIVLWPTSQYLNEAYKQLHNTNHNKKSNTTP